MKVLIIAGEQNEVVVVKNEDEARSARESQAFDSSWSVGTSVEPSHATPSNVVAFPGGTALGSSASVSSSSSGTLGQSGQSGLNDQVDALEERLVNEAMAKTGQNQVRAARLLQISRGALQHKLKKYATKFRQAA